MPVAALCLLRLAVVSCAPVAARKVSNWEGGNRPLHAGEWPAGRSCINCAVSSQGDCLVGWQHEALSPGELPGIISWCGGVYFVPNAPGIKLVPLRIGDVDLAVHDEENCAVS